MSKTYTVEDFAKMGDVEVATARGVLRKLKAKKDGNVYAFQSNKQMEDLWAKARSGKTLVKKKAVTKKKAAPKED